MVIGQENLTTDWGSWDDSFGDGAGILLFHRFMFEIDDKPGYDIAIIPGIRLVIDF